ncbi:MAG: hypothetical protein HOK97_16775 [Deltaproteobacteria bacterium]|jgi:hypothetical protein|nr:hypothetical protein [Deltaproteobacteria bacterium]
MVSKSLNYFSSLALIPCFVACGTVPVDLDSGDTSEGSSDNSFDPSAGQGSTDETNTTSSEDTQTSDETGTTPSEDGSTNDETPGACTNATDMALVDSGAVDAEANRCGPGCILNGAQCTIDCITEAIDLSEACAGCYAEMMSCSASNCAMACFADSESAACRTCVEESCGPQFEDCSGVDSQDDQS